MLAGTFTLPFHTSTIVKISVLSMRHEGAENVWFGLSSYGDGGGFGQCHIYTVWTEQMVLGKQVVHLQMGTMVHTCSNASSDICRHRNYFFTE